MSSDLCYLKALSETANTCFQRIKSLPKRIIKNKQTKMQNSNPLQFSLSFQLFTLINMPYSLSLLLEWQCFAHLLQKLLSKVIDLARSKCSLAVFPLALFDWASELLKDLWQAHCLWSGLALLPSHVAQWRSQQTVPRSRWFKLSGQLNPTQISQ